MLFYFLLAPVSLLHCILQKTSFRPLFFKHFFYPYIPHVLNSGILMLVVTVVSSGSLAHVYCLLIDGLLFTIVSCL